MSLVKKAVLVGLGGTGSALAEPLARLLRYHTSAGNQIRLELWDGDRYDEDNLARQVGAVPGENKASVWERRLRPLLPGTVGMNRYLSDDDHWLDADLMILAVDNWASRRMVLDKPPTGLVVLPGNDEVHGTCDLFRAGHPGGEDTMAWLGARPSIPDVKDRAPRNGGCQRRSEREPQTIAANFTAATLVLWGVTNWLDGKPLWPRLSFDFRRMEVNRV